MSTKTTTFKERILQLSEYQEDTKKVFFDKIGISYSNFTGTSKKASPKADTYKNIIEAYPQVNIAWLITGKGSMLKEEPNATYQNGNGNMTINLAPVRGDVSTYKQDAKDDIERLQTLLDHANETIKYKDEIIESLRFSIQQMKQNGSSCDSDNQE